LLKSAKQNQAGISSLPTSNASLYDEVCLVVRISAVELMALSKTRVIL